MSETIAPLKIMIADDDPNDLDFLRFLFDNHQSFEIVGCFHTGKQILEEIIDKGNVPDVLITDMYMPLMNGSEAVEALLSKNAAKDLEIFIISNSIITAKKEAFGDNAQVKFLEKPLTLSEVNDIPETVLEKLHLRHVNKI